MDQVSLFQQSPLWRRFSTTEFNFPVFVVRALSKQKKQQGQRFSENVFHKSLRPDFGTTAPLIGSLRALCLVEFSHALTQAKDEWN